MGDCDDGDASVSPAGKEECNGRDDDCGGDLDEYSAGTWYVDEDGDGWGTERGDDCEGTTVPGDCDDADAAVHPTAEDAPGDGVDADCDGVDPAPVEEEAPSDKPPRKEPKVSAGCTTAQGGAWTWLFVPLALVRRRRG